MFRGTVISFLLLFALLPVNAGDIRKKLPSMRYLVQYGCSVTGPALKIDHNDPRGRETKVWSAHCWAAHKSPFDKKAVRDWKIWLADRDSLEEGNKDCMKWMKRVRKAFDRWQLEQKVRIVEPKEKE